MITVRFFAMLKDKIGKDEIEIPFEKEITLNDLKKDLGAQFPEIATFLEKRWALISINQEFAASDAIIKDGDEVAILPSFSGGV